MGVVRGRGALQALVIAGLMLCAIGAMLLGDVDSAHAAYTFSNCASCHTTYPDAHSLNNCTACHATNTGDSDSAHFGWSPAPAGSCIDSGCHYTGPASSYVHGADLGNGTPWYYAPESPLSFYDGSVSTIFSRYAGPGYTQLSGGAGYRTNGGAANIQYSCGFCHSASYPSVPQHDAAALETLHQSDIAFTSCTDCHSNSLADEAGHTSCLTCHGPSAPAIAQAAIAAGDTSCASCHPGYTLVHDAAHGGVSTPACVSCHTEGVSAIHASCSSCHTPMAPAGATCITCHPDYVNPHGAGVRTWGEMDYYTWGSTGRDGSVLYTLGANPDNPGVHGNYLANTAKCGICHSVHRAKADGVKLLNSSTTTCIGCHAVGSTATAVTVNVGAGPHSVNTSCNTRGCHVDNPHGANGSSYKIVAAKLLSKAADNYLTTKALSNPTASGISLTELNAAGAWPESTRSAVRTGYTCNIEGCHYQTLLAVVKKGWAEDRKGPRYDLTDHREVTGHMSVGAANTADASYVPVSSCVSCHDQTDSLAGNGMTTVSGYTFPHGQTPSAGSTNNTGGARAYLWYTTAGDALGTSSGFFTAPNDKAFDGACLKCHRDGAGAGIGLTH